MEIAQHCGGVYIFLVKLMSKDGKSYDLREYDSLKEENYGNKCKRIKRKWE